LADEFEPAREPLVLDSLKPQAGMVGFFEHETHFGNGLEAAPGGSDCAIFCGGRRDAPNQLSGDHPGSKFRNKIVDLIEQSAHETSGRIYVHITIVHDVM
jgi:hypothetical protein